MVKSVLVLGMALAATAASASSLHGYHRNPRTEVRPFGPSARGATHYTVYSKPVKVTPPSSSKRQLRVHKEHGRNAEVDAAVRIATAYLGERHGIKDAELRVKSAYRSKHNGVTHVYFKQVINGLEVVNGNANVNIDKHGRIISSGNSFSRTSKPPAEDDEPGWLESAESSVLETWEAAQELARGAFGKLMDEISHELGWAKEIAKDVVDRLRIQGNDGDGDVIDLLDNADARVGAHRQHMFGRRDMKSEFISVKEALQRLAYHIKEDLLPHHMADVNIESVSNVDGEPELQLSGLPSSFAVGGQVGAKAAFLRLDDGTLVETWDLTVEQDNHWWNAQVNARTGKVDSLVDWTSNYVAEPEAYHVYPWQVADPEKGERSLVKNPADPKASPKGWAHGNQTAGNNVYAQINPDGGYSWEHNYRPTSADRVFDYPLDLTKEPSSYIEAAVTQLFYTNNFMHDLSYHYGFDEAAGNFQQENFSGEGRGGDAVIANAQDGSGYNNANFATPPDGRHPRMRMYVWRFTDPNRDSGIDQGIVAHEYSHGISIRLTGGPANSNCLSFGESGGMGEGWGDAIGLIISLSSKSTSKDDMMTGAYSAGRGLRTYPYSTNMETNPLTYGIMNEPKYWEVHQKGEVWAEILYEVFWNLIDEHGFTEDLLGHDLTKGNTLALQLLLDGMKLQPCLPGFIDARDAILLADRQLTDGKNQCILWKAFAKRGLGVGAELEFDSPWGSGSRIEDFGLPSECK
ncbi:hypothetical protein H4R20_005534 [Coemansia guatemalensis]|uniref:Extracellular metalloproteinase n=1 Tax=Coemansia guatemalensis TaxID=2761395 RepID=A0A9W8HVH0_9FUNG|nr:hypothetical protein H4R20_005534 [Coemansia guatemalensis]